MYAPTQILSQNDLGLLEECMLVGAGAGGEKFPPHIRLWAAVLRRASVDYALYCDHENARLRRLGDDAAEWLLLDCYDGEVFNSFLAVCDNLGLTPSVIRKAALTLTEENARKLRGMEFDDS